MKSFKAVSIGMILFIACGTLYLINQQQSKRTLSDVITESAPQLGQGAHLLLPNLNNAVVVAPDRPHDPSEVNAADRFEQITRRREFNVNTDANGFRQTNPFPSKVPKILCVGDSVTFGWGVSEEESYPYLLANIFNTSVLNAGVPAMKPHHIANWMSGWFPNTDVELVLFARRIDWMQPDPWNSYFHAIESARKTVKPAHFVLILPPISTFDPRGVQNQKEELDKITSRFPNLPVLDLTAAFRENMPKHGIILKSDLKEQIIIDVVTGEEILSATAPKIRPGQPALAPEITDYFESHPDQSEPLFFDGGHPTATGFKVFADTLAEWLIQEELMAL
jgi:lysophospholipase L1-like esterase